MHRGYVESDRRTASTSVVDPSGMASCFLNDKLNPSGLFVNTKEQPGKDAKKKYPFTIVPLDLGEGRKELTLGDNGAFNWRIQWGIGPEAKKGGYIIQEVTWTWSVTNQKGEEVPNELNLKSPVHYWEAWKVPAKSHLDIEDAFDQWGQSEHPDTKGTAKI